MHEISYAVCQTTHILAMSTRHGKAWWVSEWTLHRLLCLQNEATSLTKTSTEDIKSKNRLEKMRLEEEGMGRGEVEDSPGRYMLLWTRASEHNWFSNNCLPLVAWCARRQVSGRWADVAHQESYSTPNCALFYMGGLWIFSEFVLLYASWCRRSINQGGWGGSIISYSLLLSALRPPPAAPHTPE